MLIAAITLGVLLAVAVAVVFERAMRRFLPLATLLRLTMLFPDAAPSRYKIARMAGLRVDRGKLVDEALREGVTRPRAADDDRGSVADQAHRLANVDDLGGAHGMYPPELGLRV